MSALIISSFPGIEKHKLYNNPTYIDLDYSKYNLKDYIKEIKKQYKEKQLITVSSHIHVREALIKNKIPFIYVLPILDRKAEFLEKYKKYEYSKEFIDKVDKNWDNWMMISAYNNQYPVYFAKYGYLSENMERIIQEYLNFYKLK